MFAEQLFHKSFFKKEFRSWIAFATGRQRLRCGDNVAAPVIQGIRPLRTVDKGPVCSVMML